MGYFTKRYIKICPDFEQVVPTTRHLRLNPLRGLPESTIKQLTEAKVILKETKLPLCYEFKSRFGLSGTTQHLLGQFYLQGFASQCVGHAMAPEKDWLIVDMAAAPGSKTTHLSELMKNKGKILAIDKSAERLLAVRENCERLGISNVITVRKDSRFATDLGVKADAVLLDVPCSGNYCSEENWEKKEQLMI